MFPKRVTPSMYMCSASTLIPSSKVLHVPKENCSSLHRWRLQINMMSSYQGFCRPYILSVKASSQATVYNLSKQAKKRKIQKHRPGQSKHEYHLFKRTAQSATGTKAATLVNLVMSLSNVKEEIYGALDEWVAFEIEFPKIALGKALRRLKEREQWQRIIQVSKWMLSKGQGRSIGTYSLMLKAFEMDSRMEDCQALWESILARYTNSMPKSMFVQMLHICKRQQMPGELVKVFEQMEDLRIRPDDDTLELVKLAYKQIGQTEMEQFLTAKYPPAWKYLKFKGKHVKVRLRPASEASIAGSEAGLCAGNISVT